MSSVTLAGALWVSVTVPNMPVVRALDGRESTSVSISLQSALLGIDDGNGASLRDARALAHSLGLSSTYQLPTLAQLRSLATEPTPTAPVVTQLDALAAAAPTPAPPPPSVTPPHDVTPPPSPPSPPAPDVTPEPTPAEPIAPAKPKSTSPTVTLPAAPRPQPSVPPAPLPPPTVTTTTPPAPVAPDTAPPAIAAHADVLADAASPLGAAVPYSLPTAQDVVDGTVPVVCDPAPGSTFPLGATTVSCRSEDAAHNVAQSSFTVTVRDLTGPSIRLPADAEVDPTSAAGAHVSFSASATDAVDGAVAVSCAPASGSLFPVGHSTVTCTAEDAAHNVTQDSFDVHVLADTAPPIVQPHGDLTVEATDAAGATVTYSEPAATDVVDGPVSVACAPASVSVFALGLTTVTCTAADSSHNVGRSTFTVLVQDTTAPTIQAHADLTAEAAPGGTAVVYSPPAATDAVDGSVGTLCFPASGSLFALGHTTVVCSAHDAAGNGSSSAFDVDVHDTTPPVLQSHADVVAEAAGPNGATVSYTGPAATDSLDGSVPASCAPASGSLFAIGHTTVTCTATDAAGNAATTTFDVDVRDTTGPAIQAHAGVVAEATGPAGATVTYTAPTASDLVDGALATSCAPSSGTTFALGHTTVTCTAQDAAHNSSSSTFDVNVRDTTPPSIAAHADVVAEATGPNGATVSYTAPSATDLVDGTAAACAPASGTTFALGHTTVTCTAHDTAGNQATPVTFDVDVHDTTGPAIQAHADVVAEATGPNGATVTYTTPNATDLVDGTVAAACAPASATTFALGHTTVTCTAQDTAHNTTTTTFDVDVRDTTAPAITVPSDMTVSAGSSSGIAVTFTASATDAVDGSDTVGCAPASGATFPVGHTTVTCTSTDHAGNTASRSFDVVVTTAQAVSDATQAGTNLANALGTLGLSQSVYNGLTGQLDTAGNDLLQAGDAVAAWREFNAFDASAQAQLTAAQYSQISPYISSIRSILGW